MVGVFMGGSRLSERRHGTNRRDRTLRRRECRSAREIHSLSLFAYEFSSLSRHRFKFRSVFVSLDISELAAISLVADW